jgi:sodium/bile acid cotransporter 7
MSRISLKRDWFLWGMVIAVALAALFPGPGSTGGSLHPELVTKAGIAVIFFLHGMSMSFASMRDGAKQWKAHLAIQATSFLLFPLIGLGFFHLTGSLVAPELRTGFYFLCALPSTVSSAVAMTAIARGNVPVAVFNATVSSVLGVVITPLWVSVI